jgi:hypothetical protein
LRKAADGIVGKLWDWFKTTDIILLIFLLLFLNIKIPLKLAAILFIYVARFNFKFDFSFRRERSLPGFYPLIVLFSILQMLLNADFSGKYLLVFSYSLVIWIICLLAVHQVKLAIERKGIVAVENAVKSFFRINLIVTFLQLLNIMIETGSVNPYAFEGLNYKYFTSTGDFIRGVTFDVCTTNMIINSFGIFYFMNKRNYFLSLLCFICVLLTTSNMGNIILLIFMLYVLLTIRNKMDKSMLVVYVSLFIVFMVRVAPANLDYLTGSVKKITKKEDVKSNNVDGKRPGFNSDSLMKVYISKHVKKMQADTTRQKREITNSLNELRAKINQVREPSYSQVIDSANIYTHKKIMDFCLAQYGDSLKQSDISGNKTVSKMPGKVIATMQTLSFNFSGFKNMMIGAGPGNFSSKTAFRATGLNFNGQWFADMEYISDDFKNNHLKLWTYYQIQKAGEHSAINFPNSAFNQLTGEYGLIGILLFFFFYLWKFLKSYRRLTYSRILIPLFIAFLFTDYWFENLNIVLFFELLVYLDIYKNETLSYARA